LKAILRPSTVASLKYRIIQATVGCIIIIIIIFFFFFFFFVFFFFFLLLLLLLLFSKFVLLIRKYKIYIVMIRFLKWWRFMLWSVVLRHHIGRYLQ